jgi:hypothetical protein
MINLLGSNNQIRHNLVQLNKILVMQLKIYQDNLTSLLLNNKASLKVMLKNKYIDKMMNLAISKDKINKIK